MSKPNPSDHLTTIQTSMPGDPAIDWSDRGAVEKLADHRRKRTPETLAAVPVKSGAHLTRYEVRPLSRNEYRHLSRLDAGSFDQLEAACDIAVVEILRGPDRVPIPHREISKGVSVATEDGSELLFEALGPTGMRELGALAIARADLGDAGPFVLPPGTTPAFLPR